MILDQTTDLVLTTSSKNQDWGTALRTAVRDPVQLCRILRLAESSEAAAVRAAASFPLLAPHSYIARMQVGDAQDPLLRQILPISDELRESTGFTADPVGDNHSKREGSFLHKYYGRALVITTGACAVHCRYCFRRHFPYSETPPTLDSWREAVSQIAADPTLEEVILSGGDPLTVVDAQLSELVEMLIAVPHVRRLRIHTRLPIVIPQRITGDLVRILSNRHLTTLVVIHANHPQELTAEVPDALADLVDAGIPLLNQSVLLRGVNDDADTLVELSRRLLCCRVMPYYLHQLDRVAGGAHFEVSVQRGLELVEQLRHRLPGYAVPRYVREIPGEPSKTMLR